MKKSAITVICLLLVFCMPTCFALAAEEEPDGAAHTVNAIRLSVPVRILNRTDTSFYGFYCSPASSESWGENVLGNAVWDKGITLSTSFLTDEASPSFDFMFLDKNAVPYYAKGVSFSPTDGDDLVLLLTGSAETGFSVVPAP